MTGLQSDVTYHFALKTRDEVVDPDTGSPLHWSALSNSAFAKTRDVLAPAAIADLTVSVPVSGQALLEWTAVATTPMPELRRPMRSASLTTDHRRILEPGAAKSISAAWFPRRLGLTKP